MTRARLGGAGGVKPEAPDAMISLRVTRRTVATIGEMVFQCELRGNPWGWKGGASKSAVIRQALEMGLARMGLELAEDVGRELEIAAWDAALRGVGR